MALFGAVGARDAQRSIASVFVDDDTPGIAANLAILDEAARHVGFDVDVDGLTTIGAFHFELLVHRRSLSRVASVPGRCTWACPRSHAGQAGRKAACQISVLDCAMV